VEKDRGCYEQQAASEYKSLEHLHLHDQRGRIRLRSSIGGTAAQIAIDGRDLVLYGNVSIMQPDPTAAR
jgi:hypothetical protein